MLLLSLPAGVLADPFPKRRLVIAMQAALLCLTSVLAGVAYLARRRRAALTLAPA